TSALRTKSLGHGGLDDLHLTAVVGTALGAHSVGQAHRAALGALDQTGHLQLPVGAAALVASCLGYFTLGDCHDDTSCISEFLFFLAMVSVQKLGQHRQSRIHVPFTDAGPLVEIDAAARADALAIL